jgi:hypothetical protein
MGKMVLLSVAALLCCCFQAEAQRQLDSRADQQREAQVVLTKVLSAAGVEFDLVDLKSAAIDLRPFFDAAWRSNLRQLTGSALIFDKATDAHTVALRVMTDAAARCRNGTFVSNLSPPKSLLARLRTGCSTSEGSIATDYTVAPRGSANGFIAISVSSISPKAGDEANEIGARIYQAAQLVMPLN